MSGKRAGVFLLLSTLLLACGGEPRNQTTLPEEPESVSTGGSFRTLADMGFSTPESILHDAEADVYLVSNINGPAADVDGNGFISRVSPDGNLLHLRWIDGLSPGVTLNAPKGMAIVGDTLLVADIQCVRRFHRPTGAPLKDLCIQGATFLNDITATAKGDVFFSDMGSPGRPGALYVLRNTADVPRKLSLADGTMLEGEWLGSPNGVYADASGLYVGTFHSGELFRVDTKGQRLQLVFPTGRGIDGLVSLGDEELLFSSFFDATIFRLGPDGSVQPFAEGVETPADIGFDRKRDRLLIPHFDGDAITFLDVVRPAEGG